MVVASGLSLLGPWPLKIVLDTVLQGRRPPRLLAPVLSFFGGGRETLLIVTVAAGFLITLADNAINVLEHYVTTRLHESMVLDFRSDLFQHAQRLSLAFHDKRRTGRMIFAINNQGDAMAGLLLALPPLGRSAITLIGMFWISFVINRLLTLVAVSVVPLIFLAVWYYMTRIQQRLKAVRRLEAQSLQIVHEAMQMLRVIVAFGREGHEFRRFRTQGERAVNERVGVTVQQTAFSLAVNAATALGTALVLGIGAHLALEGRLTPGQLLVVVTYIGMVYHPLQAIITTIGSLQQRVVGMRMAWALLDEQPDIADRPGAREQAGAPHEIVFDAVSFSYAGRRKALGDISFRIRRGEAVAVVGPTGAGKTTLISLIPRFYELTGGRILFDGVDVRDLTIASVRRQISLVLQEPLLFAGTIADNIRYGRLEASMDEIVDAAKAANAHDFITALPDGYETQLGERGAMLSGGERQRISVARAFLKNAPILILDEPTSSIDSRTEAVILEALYRLMEGRTTFLVAHRLSTVDHVDRVVVLDHGRLVELGTHEELLAHNGLYKQLYDMQTGRTRRQLQDTLAAGAFRGALKSQA